MLNTMNLFCFCSCAVILLKHQRCCQQPTFGLLIQPILPIQQKAPYLQICIAPAFVMADPQNEIEGEQNQ